MGYFIKNGIKYLGGLLTKKQITDALGYTPPETDTNTWRPLGTGASDACAGNDSRLSDARAANGGTADNIKYAHTNEINFKGGRQPICWFNYRNADDDATSTKVACTYKFANYNGTVVAGSVVEAGSLKGDISGCSGLTKTQVTTALGYTPPTTNTTYSAGNNITLSGTTFSLTKANVTAALGYTPPTSDTNTWRGIQNNLTSTSTSDSLSAAQGKALNDGKVSRGWGSITVNGTKTASAVSTWYTCATWSSNTAPALIAVDINGTGVAMLYGSNGSMKTVTKYLSTYYGASIQFQFTRSGNNNTMKFSVLWKGSSDAFSSYSITGMGQLI